MAIETHAVAGIVAGRNPFEYSSSSPYTLFLFQAFFIITLCHILHYPLSKIRQPKVIAEVLAGIILGPTVMGRIPHFTETCFPRASIPGLTLIANVGIILFLFIIGLEVDVAFIRRHYRVALSVGIFNMAVPFGLGCAVAVGLHNEYAAAADESGVRFTTYMVFIAVAMCITAFPVLARILTELNLINDRVGTTVLAAGITNDLLGWILLALSVTLANSGNGVTTVYILLLTGGWFLFLMYPVSWLLRFWLTRFTKDLIRGPSLVSIMMIVMMVFVSSFFTDIIGVHPIFGAFMVGVIVPRDNGFAVKFTEKIEDLVNVILIPTYFALSGLNTNLGLLNRGIDWAYVVGIIAIALVGKISGGFVAAKFNGLLWRESLGVGVLMSCKGIVEIVVLTTGLNAGIISQRVFSMFIVMALITTFLTTPLTILTYPVWYREKVKRFIAGDINWDGTPIASETTATETLARRLLPSDYLSVEEVARFRMSRVVVVLESLESITNLMRLLHNLAGADTIVSDTGSSDVKESDVTNYALSIHAIHVKEFSDRTSHLIRASAADASYDTPHNPNYIDDSSFLTILRIFSELHGIHYSSQTVLTTIKNRAEVVCDNLIETSDLLIASLNTTQANDWMEAESAYTITETGSVPERNHSEDYTFFKQLVDQTASHLGIYIKNDFSGQAEMPHLRVADSAISEVVVVMDATSLSPSDLLALHVALKMSFSTNSYLDAIRVVFVNCAKSAPQVDALEALVGRVALTVPISVERHERNGHTPAETMASVVDAVAATPSTGGLANVLFVSGGHTLKPSERLFTERAGALVGLAHTRGFSVFFTQAA